MSAATPPPPGASRAATLEDRAARLTSRVGDLPLIAKLVVWLALFPLLVGASVLVADPTTSGRVQAVVAGGFSLLAGLIVLVGPFAIGDAEPSAQRLASLDPSPLPAETVTVKASPTPAETITLEASPLPAETVTATAEPLPAETVTVEAEPVPAETVTETVTEVETEYIEVEPQGLLDSSDSGDSGSDGGSVYFENCDAARAAGAAPVRRGDPGYGGHLDRDDDGIGCE